MKKLLLLALVLLAGCGEDPASTARSSTTGYSEQTTLKEVYDVEYADGVAVIEGDTMRYLQSADTNQLTFSDDAHDVLKLQQGQVVIFSRHTLGRVVSVKKSSGTIVVQTTPAKFTEAFRNATIELETRIEWRQPVTVAVRPRLQLISSAVAAEETAWAIKGKFDYKGVKADVAFIPKSADRLEIEINASIAPSAKMKSITRSESIDHSRRVPVTANDILDPDASLDYSAGIPESSGAPVPGGTVAATVAKVKVTGHVSGFVQALQINVRDSNLEKFDFRIRDLSGEIRVEGAGLQDAAGSFELSLPVEYIIPVPIGVIPVAVKVGASIKLTPQVHLGSSKFCFRAQYAASTGLSFETGSLKNQSMVRTKKVALCGREETVSAGQITVGFGATANVPEVSLLIFGNTIVPSIGLNYGGVTNYEPGILSAKAACQSGNTDLKAVVKIVLSFFGVEVEGEHKLWQQKKEWTCDGKIVRTSFDPINGEQKTTTDASDE